MNIDLSKSVEVKMQEMIANGKLDKIITDHIEGMIQSAVREVFSSYGETAKQLQAIIKDKVKLDFSKIDFDEYNHNMSVIVKKSVESILTENGSKKLQEILDDMMKDQPPVKMKLSELVERMKESSHVSDEKEISLHVSDRSHGYAHIYLDERGKKDRFRCKYQLMIQEKENRLCLVRIDEREWKGQLLLGGLHGFEALLFKMYSAGTLIELDEDEVDLHYSGEEE